MGICGTKPTQKQNQYAINLRPNPIFSRPILPTQNNEPPGPSRNSSPHKTPLPVEHNNQTLLQHVTHPQTKDATGLSPEEVNSIGGVYLFDSKTRRDANECIICLVGFKNNERLKVLQCLHTYHQKCIDEWLTKQPICPDCRMNVR